MDQFAINENQQQEHTSFYRNVVIALLMVLVIWTVKMIETFAVGSLSQYGLRPGQVDGLIGILTMPFLHGDFEHLISNSIGLFITALIGLQIYPKSFWRSFALIYILGHSMTWYFARGDAVHIGASGIIYGLWGFLLMGAFIRRDRPAGGAAMVVVLLFAGMIWGTLPIWVDKSWEGHLFGMLSGLVAAAVFSAKDRIQPKLWPEEVQAQAVDAPDLETPEALPPTYTQPESQRADDDSDYHQNIRDPAWHHILDQWERDIQHERFRNRTPND